MIERIHVQAGTALVAAFMLGSCGGGGGAVVALEPGQWEMTMRVTSVRMDNMPPEMREQMRGMRANETSTSRDCMRVTADVIRIQNLRMTVPQPGRPEASCRIAELSMEGGRIRGELSCEGMMIPGSRTMSMSGRMNGSYTAQSMDFTAGGEMRIGAQNGSVEVRVTGRRIGACTPPRPYLGPPPTVMVPQPTPPGAVPVPDAYSPPAENMAANAM
ncbi:MAG TPA: DUF3617 domain-containing protein [Allosphingosinicella sp.]|nr:DUF3617 domain-containing protein [Allosphingosinicella sp.]